jgi:hypothetical protein
MSDATGPVFDPAGEARSVLQSAVADFGPLVLSNPAIVDGICEDRLPEWPREASLISTAARADVAAMLQQQAGGIGADTAVRLTARTLADTRSLDRTACVWVVSEFARALGYQVSEGLQPAGHGAARPAAGDGGAGAGAVGDGTAGAAAAGGAAAGAVAAEAAARPPGDAATAAPPEPPPSRGGPPGEDLTVPPASPDQPAGGQAADFGHVPTVTSGAPPGPGGVGQDGGGPPGPPAPPGRPARAGGPNQKLLLAGGVAALVVLYFILAGATHLPPFGKVTPTPTPAPTLSHHRATPQPTPSTPSATPTLSTAGLTGTQRTLAALIPGSVSANNSCHPVGGGHFGSVAEFHCTGAPSMPTDYVEYYMFSTPAALNSAYILFLSDFAHSSENTGPCSQVTGSASFRTFAPCETSYHVGNSGQGGRIMEYVYKGTPDVSTTYASKLVLVDMEASTGNDLLAFWDHIPDWLSVSTR